MKKNLSIIGIIACLMFTGAFLYARSAGSSASTEESRMAVSTNATSQLPVSESATQPAPSAGRMPSVQEVPPQPAAPESGSQTVQSYSGPQPESQNVGVPTGMGGYGMMGGMGGSSEGGAAAGMSMGGMGGMAMSATDEEASTGTAGGGQPGMMGFGYMGGPSQPGYGNTYGGMGMMGGGMGMGYGMGGFGMAGIPIDVTGEMSIKPFPIGNLPINAVCEILQRRAGGIRFYAMPNKIVAVGSKDDLHRVQQVLNQIGASMGESVVSSLPANIAYRVYIVEVASRDDNGDEAARPEDMKSFTLELRFASAQDTLTAIDDITLDGVVIDQCSIHQSSQDNQTTTQISLSGKTRSSQLLQKLISVIQEKAQTPVTVTGMRIEKDEPAPDPFQSGGGRRARSNQYGPKWADSVPAEVLVRLPEGIHQTLVQLLGPKIKTVGYWFGVSALPGKCQTSIGVWNLSLETQESGPSDFLLELKLTGEGVEIENTVNAKIGQPALVGYNRHSEGTLLPGALVIIPCENFDGGPVSETPSKSTPAAPAAAAPAVPAALSTPK